MHTHWDREWYFTKDETKVLLKNHLVEVINFLETHPEVIYILDGQSVMLDDFMEQGSKYQQRLKNLVKNQQLRVGPWYTQTDLLLVHGESIIRNLYYGFKAAREYGAVMKVGYAPDTFGHSSQMPQIYQQFGIDSTIFWRGFSELKSLKSDFIWEGIDGSKVYGINLATGYQGAKYLESNRDDLKVRMDKILSVLDHYSTSDARLIMNGHDQMPIQKDIFNIIEHLKEIYPDDKVEISDFESYVEQIKNSDLDLVTGELTHCKHARIHKTINSTRMDLKLLNSELEYKLFHVLEPLSIMATKLNLDYPYELLDECHKALFGVHAHDSIGGCNSDLVNRDIKQRLLQVKEKVDTQIELFQRLIGLSASSVAGDSVLSVYNYLPYQRNDELCEVTVLTRTRSFIIEDLNENQIKYNLIEQKEIDAGLIDRQVAARLQDIKVYESKIIMKISAIKGLQVQYYRVKEAAGVNAIAYHDAACIENAYYQIEIDNNQINVLHKSSNAHYENLIYIENSGDAGDSYDYSPPVQDVIFNNKVAHISNIKTRSLHDIEILEAQIEYQLPLNEAARSKHENDIKAVFDIRIILDQKFIKLDITHTNQIEDSRYRLVFNPQIMSDFVESDTHLGKVIKPVYLEQELAVWEQENWVEKPVSVETYQSYVKLKDAAREAVIFSHGLKEYEVKDGAIYLTLFRSFSHLGKRNLINRPGRPSGIEIETRDNQLMGTGFQFNFMFSLERIENAALVSKHFLTSLAGYHLKEFNRFNINPLSTRQLLDFELSLNLDNAVVSAIKLNEEGELFIRLFNPMDTTIILELDDCYLSNVFEERLEKASTIELKSQEIINVIKRGI